jgi:ketopantoate reductase
MLQDLERGLSETEVDWINGGIASVARQNGLLAAMNEQITKRIHQLETLRRTKPQLRRA